RAVNLSRGDPPEDERHPHAAVEVPLGHRGKLAADDVALLPHLGEGPFDGVIRSALRQLAAVPVVQFSHRANLGPFGLRHVRTERGVLATRTGDVRHALLLLGVRPRLAELPTPLSIVESGPDVFEELPARLEL